MKLLVPATLNERLLARVGQLDRLMNALAHDVGIWRARLVQHRVAIAVVGGGIAGAAVATRWRSVLRVATAIVGATIRATAVSMVARARAERAVQKEWARAGRTN